MRTMTADLAIIGSGSGNPLITPYWDDQRVVIAESRVFGGTCLNVECIPTKMFVRPAATAQQTREAARLGVTQTTEAVDWPGIRDRVFSRIDAISAAGQRHTLSDELDNVELVTQRVRFDPQEHTQRAWSTNTGGGGWDSYRSRPDRDRCGIANSIHKARLWRPRTQGSPCTIRQPSTTRFGQCRSRQNSNNPTPTLGERTTH